MRVFAQRALLCLVVAVPSAAFAAPASADAPHTLDAFLAGDVWPSPEGGGRGIAYLGWRWRAPFGRVQAIYNTDTLTLRIDDLQFWGRGRFGLELKGQLGYAGLLPDYYERGLRRPEYGFWASYVLGAVFGQFRAGDRWFFDVRSTVRRWFFDETDDTRNFVLPPDMWAFEQKLVLTFWSFAADPSTRDAHRPSWRLRGWGFGVEAQGHLRSTGVRWGPLFVADEPQPRPNDPDAGLAFLRQWAAVGVRLAPGLRLQLIERAGWGFGEDDLTRARIGGLNPYVVPIAGLPWAAFLSGQYLSGQATLHIKIFGDLEIGPQIDVAAIRDVLRVGDDTFSAVVGIGAFVDARWGPWQGELRVGFSPDVGGWQVDGPHVSFYALLGRSFVL